MKKNKTVAFMLAATLMVGGTFLGTKALFSDKTAAKNDLVIKMGKVNVTVDENASWSKTSLNTEANEGAANGDFDFSNVKPGDTFEKVVTVTNAGTLEQTISIGDLTAITEETTGKEIKPDGFNAKLMIFDKVESGEVIYKDYEENSCTLGVGENKSTTFKIVVELDKDAIGGLYNDSDNNNYNKDDSDPIKIENFYNDIEITAVQSK